MKAKLKKTGEIVNLAKYATIELDYCNSWGNPVKVRPEDIELIQEPTEDEHWQEVREHAAIAAIQGMLSCGEGAFSYQGITDDIARAAVDYADSLIEELKRK